MADSEKVPCPFVYSRGKLCGGFVVRVEAYRADLEWVREDDGGYRFGWSPRTHYHVLCSERGNHAGIRGDDGRMKFWLDELPESLRSVVLSR